MAESKQYITQVQQDGNVLISEDVIGTIVSHAVSEVEGVACMGYPGKISRSKSTRISIHPNDKVTIDCNISIYYGQSVVEVAKTVQEAIINAVDSMTGVTVGGVNVNVVGIVRK